MADNDRILREPEERALTGLSRTTRYMLEREGKYPEAVQLTGRARGHWMSHVMKWLEERERGRAKVAA
jgi:prophage regulatory protein